MSLLQAIPTFPSGSTTHVEFRTAYDSIQCICFKNKISQAKKKRKRPATRADHQKHLQYMLDTFQTATPKDQASWCIESEDLLKASTKPVDFLSPSASKNGYCSFVLQDDSTQSVTNLGNHYSEHSTLPLSAPPDDASSIIFAVVVTSPYWLFVGRNTTTKNMVGRSEHTDGIQHDGTFHYQLAGSKIWNLRPTEELRSKCDLEYDMALLDSYSYTVEEGDVLLINTRLWWHRTEIPGIESDENGSSDNEAGLSISFARDIYLDGREPKEGDDYMTNVEGGMAAAFIPKGTILLTEADPPVGRSANREKANCDLVQVDDYDNSDDDDDEEERIQMALVPTRDIDEGEFFIIFDDTAGSDTGS